MKAPLAEYLTAYAGCGFMLAMVFGGTFGLPDYFGSLFLIASMACIYLYWRLRQHRVGSDVEAASPYAATFNRWIVPLIVFVAACAVASLFFELFKR